MQGHVVDDVGGGATATKTPAEPAAGASMGIDD